ncbi:histone-lysine N-methyltransferase SETMAR [Trichonephila clavipes]|nr:histone-lysine N-methyltransferase SETMAR [Trichonephila clavipes]
MQTTVHSPDLNYPEFFVFPRFKLALKGKRFDDILNIQRNVTWLLYSIPKEDLLQSFLDMYNRSQWCIVMGGDYFEGQAETYRWILITAMYRLDIQFPPQSAGVPMQKFRSSGQSDVKPPEFNSQASLVLIYRPTEGMKGSVDLAQPGI